MIFLGKINKILPFLLLCTLLSTNIYAQLDSIPLDNEKAYLLKSKILDQSRSVWVHLPYDYATTNQTYPVLYLLDGDGHFKYVSQLVDYLSSKDRNNIPEMIVVGIPNINRGKDLQLVHPLHNTKQDSSIISTSEGGGKFLRFIQQELVPDIESKYRTQPYRILMGHSLAGQLALYTKNMLPDLFGATILISPAILDANPTLLPDFGHLLQQQKQRSGKMFITIGDEDTEKLDMMVQSLKMHAPKSFAWDYRQYKDENHFSVTYKSMFDALKFIYTDWFIDFRSKKKMSYKDIEEHFKKLSSDFGYVIKPNESFVNNCGYMQLRAKNIDEAIDIFKHNIENFPASWNVYDSMGEAYTVRGNKELAISNYEKSIRLNPNNEDGKEMLKKLKTEK
jgi:predicted alpha/beta superfamily hydrolase